MSPQIWVVGAGKGGVGKTFVATSLGVTISRMNQKVLLVDLDPSGANVHTAIGQDLGPGGMEKFWYENVPLSSLIQSTKVLRLSMIQGACHHWIPWVPGSIDAARLMQELRKLEFDVIIVDAGPGANQFQLELLNKCDQTLIVTSPEPPSIEKTYRLLESILSYRWTQSDPKILHRLVSESLFKYRKSLATAEIGFHDFVLREFPDLAPTQSQASQPRMRLIVNSARCGQDHDLGYSIKSVSKKHFNLDLQYLGAVDYDNAVWQTMRNFQMVLVDKPLTPVTAQVLNIAKAILESKMDASFERAVI